MTLFLITFILVYGSMHVYTFLRIRAAFPGWPGWFNLLLAVFMSAMIFAPFIIRVLEKQSFDLAARLLSQIGYIWMGFLFLFFVSSLIMDTYRFFLHAGEWMWRKDFSSLIPSARQTLLLPLLVAVVITGYGYSEARHIRIERIQIKSPKIPAGIGRVRIVQISDVHIGLMVTGKRLQAILGQVEKLNPDILVSTGDLLDGQVNGLRDSEALLRQIKPRYGKFAVLGNHEYYSGFRQAVSFVENAGFVLLRGESSTIPGIIHIAGTDDPAGKGLGLYRDIPEKELLSTLSKDLFVLFLKHRPFLESGSSGLFDLQLSGHTHQGQIFPFRIFTHFMYRGLDGGFFHLQERSYLYVSRGSGTWGPPVRFLTPPEVTLIELVRE
ncbi:MAG: metallophosphoesterase [Syntrophales bacterium]